MADNIAMPEAGMPAPPFEGVTQDGETISLDDFKGRKLALYFYPRDNTPGCTKQACNLRDNFDTLKEHDIAIVGVSDDPVAKHRSFADTYDLPFPLLADEDRTVLGSYGAYGQKNMYGRVVMGTKRTTFLIDEDGTIVKVYKRPKTTNHAEEILTGFGIDSK